MSTRILEPGEIGQVAPFPQVVLPRDKEQYALRERRFAQLAHGHAMAPLLDAMASLARAQHATFNARGATPLADHLLDQSRTHGMPPLSYQTSLRDSDWQTDLRAIAAHLVDQQAAPWLPAVTALATMHPDACDAMAEAVLLGADFDGEGAHQALLAPVIGAALQVWWSRQAATLSEADVGLIGSSTVCPVCASRPVASVVEIGGNQANLRYLLCALCSTQWHMVRVTCSSCESTKGVAYYSLNGAEADAPPSRKIAFARAEACDACHSYLKIFTREKEPLMEVTADDLATLTLDLLVDEAGYLRSGPNLLFSPGVSSDT